MTKTHYQKTTDLRTLEAPKPAKECRVPTFSNKLARFVFQITWFVFARFTPIPLHGYRAMLLRLFGADLRGKVFVYPTIKIWAPWNLEMHSSSCLGPHVECYNVAKIKLCANSTISQRSYLCSASHDHSKPNFPLITSPIVIGPKAWVAAETFVGPGVTIGTGTVTAARSVLVKSTPDWVVIGGNPAKIISQKQPF